MVTTARIRWAAPAASPLLSRNTPREYSCPPAKVIFNLRETCHVDSFDSDRVSNRDVYGTSTGQFNPRGGPCAACGIQIQRGGVGQSRQHAAAGVCRAL